MDRTITFTESEVWTMLDMIQTYAGDAYDPESYLMDKWFLAMIEARAKGEADPEKPSEEELAAEKHRPKIREGTVWKWQGGFDGEYVDTGEEPDFMMKMASQMVRYLDTPFVSAFPSTVTIGDPGTKMEWGWSRPAPND